MSFFHSMISQPAPISYSVEYQEVLDYATLQGYALPSDAENTQYNQAVVDAVAEGVLDKLDVWWPMLANIDFATINFKSPGTYNLGLSANPPTYDPATGFTGNGTTSYLTTGWIPNNSLIYLQNDASIGYGCLTDVSSGMLDFGTASNVSNFAGIVINPRNASNNLTSRFNCATAGSKANANGIGRYHMDRSGSASYDVHKNGISLGNNAQASQGRSTFELYICGYNLAGTLISPSSRSIQYLWAGSNLTGLESTWDTILSNLYA